MMKQNKNSTISHNVRCKSCLWVAISEIWHQGRVCWTYLNLAVPSDAWCHVWQLWIPSHEWNALRHWTFCSAHTNRCNMVCGTGEDAVITVVEGKFHRPYSNFMPVIRKSLEKLRLHFICFESFSTCTVIHSMNQIAGYLIWHLKFLNIHTPLNINEIIAKHTESHKDFPLLPLLQLKCVR